VIPLSATMPLGPSFPPKLQIVVPSGFILGLLLSAGLVFLLDFLDDSVKSPSDVKRHLNIPLLGMVPYYEEEEAPLGKISHLHPQALISEAYRRLRTNLYFSAPIEDMKSILVTSSRAGCGKTTTAANLAITLALEGKRVLLVDGNFRRPMLGDLFDGERSGRGLSNILVGQLPAAEVIRHSEVAGLDVVETGPAPPNPAVLLSSSRMQDFLTSQRANYDHIIVDGPPTLVVTDARIMAGLADGTIVVVHAGDTSRGILQRTLSELRNDQVHILGVLLNAVRTRKGGYFRESYRSYYDYASAEVAPVAALPGGESDDDI